MSAVHPVSVDDPISFAALAAGTANVIMQLSWPEVGHGVVESRVDSGKVTLHPIKRARTTFTYLAVSTWGDDDERRAYRRAVNGSHAQVRSTAESPVRYDAFDPELQLWVAACLYRGVEDLHHAMYPEVGFRGEHGIYELGHRLASTLQVAPERWPADRDAFDDFWEQGLARVHIDATVREYLTGLTDLTFMPSIVRRLQGPQHRFFTIGFLPQRFRDEMHFEWTAIQQRRFDRVMRAVGVVNRFAPTPVRQFPFNVYMADFRRRLRRGAPLV